MSIGKVRILPLGWDRDGPVILYPSPRLRQNGNGNGGTITRPTSLKLLCVEIWDKNFQLNREKSGIEERGPSRASALRASRIV